MDEMSYPQLRDVISASWDIQTRVIRNLQREGIQTTEELVKLTPKRLGIIRGLGPGSAQAIEEGLSKYGLSLAREVDPTEE